MATDVYTIYFGKTDDGPSGKKMVEMRTMFKGRGFGLVTSIVNMAELAEALGRPAEYILKYIGRDVRSQSKIDGDGTGNIQSAHSAAELGAALDKFIKEYVECYFCGDHETELVLDVESETISLKCGGCGLISKVHGKDKLAAYIFNQIRKANGQ